MTAQPKYDNQRGLFLFFCIIIIGAAIIRAFIAMPSHTLQPALQPVIPSPTPQKPNSQKPSPQKLSAIPKREVPSSPPVTSIEKVEEQPSYKLTPTKPTSDANDEYSLLLQECHRSGEQIICSGKVTNKTDARTKFVFHGGNAIDNEGNSAFLKAQFPGSGIDMDLLPDVPTNFKVEVYDKHQKATSLNLQLQVHWENPSTYDTPVYKDVVIQ